MLMKNYIQYKAFKTIDELNEWLKNFVRDPFNKDEKQYVWVKGTSCYILGQVQFLGQAEVGGTETKVDGSAFFYPVASYLVGEVVHGQDSNDAR